MFQYWDFPDKAAVRETPPYTITDAEKLYFEKLIRSGATPSHSSATELHIVLGIDFGTSSTKVIVRLPFVSGQPTVALPAPAFCRSNNHPYLWQTVVWLGSGGTFSPWPQTESAVLSSLKQGLMQGRSSAKISDTGGNGAATHIEAGTAYLSFVIRYAKGWLLLNRPDFFRGRTPVWYLNVGMPAASHDDPVLSQIYRRVAAAALQLAAIDECVTVKATRKILEDSSIRAATVSHEAAEGLGVAVFPETAGAMTGFAKSARGASGLYLLVDVGAMTLDACMFRLNQNTKDSDLYALMAAEVRPLGVESYHWFLAEGKSENQFIEQCKHMLWTDVVWKTKRKRDPNDINWRQGSDVPVFVCGGGSANILHQDVISSIGEQLRIFVENDGIRIIKLPVPNGIDLPESLPDFGRMVVAWGLSFLPEDIGRIRPIRDIEDVQSPTILDRSGWYVSKDQV